MSSATRCSLSNGGGGAGGGGGDGGEGGGTDGVVVGLVLVGEDEGRGGLARRSGSVCWQ